MDALCAAHDVPGFIGDRMSELDQAVIVAEDDALVTSEVPTEHRPDQPAASGALGRDDRPSSPAADPKVVAPSANSEISAWLRRFVRGHLLVSLETVGGQATLGAATVKCLIGDLFRGKFAGREFIQQAAFMAETASVPTLLVTIPMGVTLSIQFSLLAGQIGATSLSGAATGLAVIRQGAPLVAAMLLAAAVGAAIAADLGSRAMRDEIDAMAVMGVSIVRRLVVPRFAAAILVGLALTGWTCFVGFLAGYVFNVYLQDGTPGSFIATFASFATTSDLVMALVKSVVFGAIVAVVSCHKGLSTRGGPAGVANSVNAAVVETMLLLMLVNVVMSQLYILIFPRETI